MLLTQISHDSSLRSHWNIIHQVSLRTGLCHKSNRYICKAPQLTITVPRLKKSTRCDALSRHHVTCNSPKGHNFTNYVLNARDSSYKLNIFTSIVSDWAEFSFTLRSVNQRARAAFFVTAGENDWKGWEIIRYPSSWGINSTATTTISWGNNIIFELFQQCGASCCVCCGNGDCPPWFIHQVLTNNI